MTIQAEVQKLEPSARVWLYVLDATAVGGTVEYFQGMQDDPLLWQGQAYDPWPLQATGIERTTEQQARPTLTIGNVNGAITQLCLLYQDFVGAKLTIKSTFAKYLDGQPDADPGQHFPDQVWYVERKSSETNLAVAFELASPFDFAGKKLPGRTIVKGQCQFFYRDAYCNYTGPAVAKSDDTPTSDPLLDDCSRTPGGCALRQWPDNVLRFGGFPAAGLLRQ